MKPAYKVVEGKNFEKEELTLDNHVYKNCETWTIAMPSAAAAPTPSLSTPT